MLIVEIADTLYKQQEGLMFRKDLPDHAGMLFSFKKPQSVGFWGVNTYLPLDIAFIKPDSSIESISHIKPLDNTVVKSQSDCIMAIEANMDYFTDNNVKVGDYIDFSRINDDRGIINFISVKDFNPSLLKTKVGQRTPFVSEEEMQDFVPVDNEGNRLPVYRQEDFDQYLEDDIQEQEDIPPQPNPDVQENLPEGFLVEPVPEVVETDKDYPEFEHPAIALAWAEENKEIIRIYYKTRKGIDIERDVEPHGQFVARTTGNQIVVTYDNTIGNIRAFIVNNIMYYSFTGKQFKPKFRIENGTNNPKIRKSGE